MIPPTDLLFFRDRRFHTGEREKGLSQEESSEKEKRLFFTEKVSGNRLFCCIILIPSQKSSTGKRIVENRGRGMRKVSKCLSGAAVDRLRPKGIDPVQKKAISVVISTGTAAVYCLISPSCTSVAVF